MSISVKENGSLLCSQTLRIDTGPSSSPFGPTKAPWPTELQQYFFCFLLKTRDLIAGILQPPSRVENYLNRRTLPAVGITNFISTQNFPYTNNSCSGGTSWFDRANERCFLDPRMGRGRREKGVMEMECSRQPALGTVLPAPCVRGCSALTQLLRSSGFTLFLAPSWDMKCRVKPTEPRSDLLGWAWSPECFQTMPSPTPYTHRCRTPNQRFPVMHIQSSEPHSNTEIFVGNFTVVNTRFISYQSFQCLSTTRPFSKGFCQQTLLLCRSWHVDLNRDTNPSKQLKS